MTQTRSSGEAGWGGGDEARRESTQRTVEGQKGGEAAKGWGEGGEAGGVGLLGEKGAEVGEKERGGRMERG